MKIRINQDVTFNWKLTVEGESVDLSKLELSVELTTPSNKKIEITPNIQFDTLEFNYRPKQVGEYILSAYLNRFKDGETALDIKAFEGVKYTWNQDFSTDDNLEANYVELTGDFNFGPKLDIYKITYTDLVNLRNNAQLTSGRLYQITDYVTTTTQEGTKSAGHPFDVIVFALSENELSEHACAIQHSGDTYFTDCDLNTWKIWYCLDNDTARFAWADGTNGKGVIYRMIDEFNNDIPYDFKNIQFKHPKDTTKYPHYYYTFASSNIEDNTDYSLSIANNCYSNVIKEYITSGKRTLNQIIFIGPRCHSNTFGSDCLSITFEEGCFNNTFGFNCFRNYFRYKCHSNTFGSDCGNNTFGYNIWHNTFGDGCGSNTFGNIFSYNTFGSNCSNNTFVTYASGSTLVNCLMYNKFESGIKFCTIVSSETSSFNNQVQNYHFKSSMIGTSSNKIVIEVTRNLPYDTTVALNSTGEVKTYCEADLSK